MSRGRYGIDAPGLVLGFLLAGIGTAGASLGLLRWASPSSWSLWVACLLFLCSAYGIGMGAFMLWGSLITKVKSREAVLDQVRWTGHEMVLDIGCGRGLLLVGAAHKLTTGRAIGIDLWLSRDQSSNTAEATLGNARVEGVADRVSVKTGDMRELPFVDSTFDVVVSSWAVHNVEPEAERKRVLAEMVRLLKPRGTILLNDIVNRDEYVVGFKRLGLTDVKVVAGSRWKDLVCAAVSFGSFRPATVVAKKDVSGAVA